MILSLLQVKYSVALLVLHIDTLVQTPKFTCYTLVALPVFSFILHGYSKCTLSFHIKPRKIGASRTEACIINSACLAFSP